MSPAKSTFRLRAARFAFFGLGLVTIIWAGSSQAQAQEDPNSCAAPGLATRIAPFDVKPEFFTGVLRAADGVREFDITIPAGAHMELEVVVRRQVAQQAWPWSIGVYADAGGKEERVPVKWDDNPWMANQDRFGAEVTERASGITLRAARLNTPAKIRLSTSEEEITYIVRARPKFYGDAGTRLDTGGRAESALPIQPATVVEGNFADISPDVGWNLDQSAAESVSFDELDTRPADDTPPVMIDHSGDDSVADEILGPAPGSDPLTDQDQSSPVAEGAFAADDVDIYRLQNVPAGSKISSSLVAAEELRTGLRPRLAPNLVTETWIEILRGGCDADGNFILLETSDGDAQYLAASDEYVVTRPGDYFVRVSGVGPEKYWIKVDYEEVGLPFLMDPPYFEMVEKHLPAEPAIGAPVHMGFRLRNLPDFVAAGVRARFQFLDAKSHNPLEDVESKDERCSAGQTGAFTCDFGEIAWGGHKDTLFTATLPRDGILWLATWESADGVGGEPSTHGWIGRDAKPQIRDVYVLGDQTADLYGVPSYPYPFNPWAREGLDYRTLFVTGWKLPQKLGDDLKFASPDNTVEYRYVAYPDTDNPIYQELYKRGWARYREENGLSPTAEIPDGLDGLIIRANLRQGILPGFKELKINDANAPWEVQFGGIETNIRFVHADETAAIDNAYIPEAVQIIVDSNVPLPLQSIDILLYEDLANGPGARVHRISAKLQEVEGAKVQRFVTSPIVLSAPAKYGTRPELPGQLIINAEPGSDRPVRLRAEVDPNFRAQSFAVPVMPGMAEINLLDSPMDEPIAIGLGAPAGAPPQSLFELALKTAAACKGITVADWDSLDLQNREADYFWNVVLLTFFDNDIRTEDVTIGHHAAVLLLRQMFVDHLDRAIRQIGSIQAQDEEVLGLLKRMAEHFADRNFPINRIMVTAPDGTEVEYGTAVTFDDHAEIAREYGFGTGPEAEARAYEWRVAATREALAKLKERTQEIRDKAAALDACDDVRDLVRLTGAGFDVVRASLSPKLRKLETHPAQNGHPAWSEWAYDSDAHFWDREVAPLLLRVKEQEREARQDTDLLIAMTAVLSVPVSAGAGGSAYVAFAFSLLDLSATAWVEMRDYIRSQRELDFSEKAGIVLGFERNEQAEREAKAFAEVLFNVGISAYFAGMDGLELIDAVRAARPVVRGMNVTRSLRERGITSLSDIERRNFATFAMRSRLRQLRLGSQNLTDLERTALDEVDTVIKNRVDEAAAAAAPDPNLPAAVPDSRELNVDLGAGGEPVVRPVEEPVIDTPEAFEAVPRGPPEDVNPIQVFADQVAEQVNNDTIPPSSHAGHRLTARELGPELAGHELRFEVAPGDVRTVSVGEFYKGGATTATFTSDIKTPSGRETLGRLTIDTGGHKAASSDAYGAGVIEKVDSPHMRLPELADTFDVNPATVGLYDVVRVQFAERIETAQELVQRIGELTDAHVDALMAALKDLNDAGYAWLDLKWDNFGFVTENGRLRVVIIDTGGIVRAAGGSAEVARRLQRMAVGDFVDVFPGYRIGRNNAGIRTAVRRTEITENMTDQVDFADMEGIDGWKQFGFTPAGGEQLEGFAARFAAATEPQ